MIVKHRLFAKGAFRLMEDLHRRSDDLRRVFEGPIDATVRAFFMRQFASGGRAAVNNTWAPLSPVTRALKRRAGKDRGILRQSDRLYKSYVQRSGKDVLLSIGPHHYERLSAVPYAGQHQRGWLMTHIFGRPMRNPRRVPARRVATDPLPKRVERDMTRSVAYYVTTGKLVYGDRP